jgi:hypothetical protein
MANDYFPHLTAQKNAIQAKDKIKPGSAAGLPGFSHSIYKCITPKLFELVICQM